MYVLTARLTFATRDDAEQAEREIKSETCSVIASEYEIAERHG